LRTSKTLSWLMAVMFVITTAIGGVPLQANAANGVNDINGHWAQSQIQNMITRGVIAGYPDNTFKPDNSITRAEFITMTNRAFSFNSTAQINYTDVHTSDWFAPEIAKAKAAGYISGYLDGSMKPNNQITRQEVAVIIANVMKLDTTAGNGALSKYSDAAAIPAWSSNAIAAMVKAGYLNGYPDGTFKALEPTTRAMAAVILSSTLIPVVSATTYSQAGTYGPATGISTITGDVTISSDGVILQNTAINGNLLITEAVGAGTVTLSNVSVSGTTTIKGGGANSIKIINSILGKIIINKADGKIRLVLSGTTTIKELIADSAANIVGTAVITTATINANGVTVEPKPVSTTVKSGITAIIAGETVAGTPAVSFGGPPASVAVTGVTLNQNTLELFPSGTASLTATVAPANATNKNVVWTTNHSSVATVNNGVVTAVDGGTAEIKVTTVDGSYSATCNVTVLVPVNGVGLNQANLNMIDGGTAQLVPVVLPTNAYLKTVSWDSSDDNIVTVDNNGKVTAVAEGTASVTVTTVNGSKTATCVISVGSAPVAVTGVNLNRDTLSLKTTDSPVNLIELISPSNATNTNVNWSSSNPAVASVSNGLVTPLTKGTTRITVTTADGGFSDFCDVTVVKAVTAVSINQTQASLTDLFVGHANINLTAAITPGDADNTALIWTSSDPSVATVSSNGVVTLIAAKDTATTITATTVDGGYADSRMIRVGIRATSVSLNKSVLSVAVGGTGTLSATVFPAECTNKNVTWTSTDTAKATVNGGVVTGVLAGSTTVNAVANFKTNDATPGSCTVKVYSITNVALRDKFTTALIPGMTLVNVEFTVGAPIGDNYTVNVALNDGTSLQCQSQNGNTFVFTGSTSKSLIEVTKATVTINNSANIDIPLP